MANRLYIGNLPYSVDENRLMEIFQEYGFTGSRPHIVMDRETGRPKGFGFIELGSENEAKNAVTALNGQNIDGRSLRVDFAVERSGAPRAPRGGGGQGHW